MQNETTLKRLLAERHLATQQFADMAGLNKRSLEPYVSGAKKFDIPAPATRVTGQDLAPLPAMEGGTSNPGYFTQE